MPKFGELKREFQKAGCYKESEGHNQQEVPTGTEKILRKQAGVPKKH